MGISRITFNMNKFIVAVALFGAVMGDGTGHGHSAPAASASGYAAPADAYASPAAEYAAPSYEAAPTGYDSGYGVPAADGLDFDLSQLTELLPLFVAVFGGIFTPLGQIKFDLINANLNPLGYQ